MGRQARRRSTTTLQHGIRYTDERRDPRLADAGLRRDGILTPAQIDDVAELRRSRCRAGQPDAAAAERGKQLFAENCAACHGEDGKGNRELGAPNLTDGIWLYGGEPSSDRRRRSPTPRHGVMPAWARRLDEATIKELAVYVHSLGGGE